MYIVTINKNKKNIYNLKNIFILKGKYFAFSFTIVKFNKMLQNKLNTIILMCYDFIKEKYIKNKYIK